MLMSFSNATQTAPNYKPDIKANQTKAHYTIGELTKEFGVTPRTLRFYEEKDLVSPQRHGLERIYTRRDRGRLRLIIIGKNVGFSLEEIKAMLDLYELGDGGKTQLTVAQEKFTAQITRLKEQRLSIDAAIKELEEGAAEVEARLLKL
jgi:DNA-binding transcriptional MerR regulator